MGYLPERCENLRFNIIIFLDVSANFMTIVYILAKLRNFESETEFFRRLNESPEIGSRDHPLSN